MRISTKQFKSYSKYIKDTLENKYNQNDGTKARLRTLYFK